MLFPDAPTERGARHIRELIKAKNEGYEAAVLFVVQMKGVKYFTPNAETDADFAQALKDAEKAGVKILAYDCIVQPDEMVIDEQVEARL